MMLRSVSRTLQHSHGFRSGLLARTRTASTGTKSGAGREGSRSSKVLGVVFFSSLVGTTLCLGTWQLQRRLWKTKLIEELQVSLKQPVTPLPQGAHFDVEALDGLRNRRVGVYGTFDHSKELLLGPRSPPKDVFPVTPGAPMSGFYLITPFERADDGSHVLVNRGWVPKKAGGGRSRNGGGGGGKHSPGIAIESNGVSRPTGMVALTGVLGAGEKRGSFDNDFVGGHLLWMDVEGAAFVTGCTAYAKDEGAHGNGKDGAEAGNGQGAAVANTPRVPVYLELLEEEELSEDHPLCLAGGAYSDKHVKRKKLGKKAVTAHPHETAVVPAVTTTPPTTDTPAPSPATSTAVAAVGEKKGEGAEGEKQWPLRKQPFHFYTFHVTPGLHEVYAATWFSLALAGMVMTFIRFRGGGKKADAAAALSARLRGADKNTASSSSTSAVPPASSSSPSTAPPLLKRS